MKLFGIKPRKPAPKASHEPFVSLLGAFVHGVAQTKRMDALLGHTVKCDACRLKLNDVILHARDEGWEIA